MAVTDGRGRPARAPGLAAWLARVGPAAARGTVTIALVSDAHIRRLNRTYRHKDTTTDVLSFPAGSAGSAGSARSPGSAGSAGSEHPYQHLQHPKHLQHLRLGDIAIATGVARRQARQAGHSLGTEFRVLALHGLLHLLGYDHGNLADRRRMTRLERRLRRAGGLPAGLIERTTR